MEWVLLAIGFLLLLLVVPLVFHIGFSFNVLSGTGGVMIRLFGIKVLFGKLALKNNNLVLTKESHKPSKQSDVVVEAEDVVTAFEFSKKLYDNIHITSVSLATVYSSQDPFHSCLVKSAIETALLQFLCILKQTKGVPHLAKSCFAGFGKPKLVFGVKARASISIIDVLTSLLISHIKKPFKKGVVT